VLSRYYSGVTKKNLIDGSSGMYGGEERYIQGFGGGILREKEHFEGLGIDGSVILIRILQELG
jgi:hypothetical protein